MAESEFIPSTLGIQQSAVTGDSANNWGNLFARAQAVSQSRQEFPLLQQQLAGQIAVQQQSRELNNIELQRQSGLISLAPQVNAATAAKAQADIATAQASIATAHASAAMTEQAMSDFAPTMGMLNSLTGTGPSTAPVALPDPNAPAPAVGTPLPSPVPAMVDYASMTRAMNAVATFKARYSNLPGAAPVISQLDGKMAAIHQAYESQLVTKVPQFEATINGATTTAQLRELGSDPDFNMAAAAFPGTNLRGQYDKVFSQLQTREQAVADKQMEAANQAAEQQRTAQAQKDQQARQIAAEQAKVQLQRQQENGVDSSTGFTGTAPTSAQASDFRDAAVQTQTANSALSQLQTLAQKLGNDPITKITDPTDLANATSLAVQIKGALREPFFGGKLTDQDSAILDKIIPNPGHVFTLESSSLAKIKSLIDTNNAKLALKAAALGLRPASQVSSGPVTVGSSPGTSVPATFSYTQ